MKVKSRGKKSVRLQTIRACSDSSEPETHHRTKQLPVASKSAPFTLPPGWFVEEKPRTTGRGQIDRYYYEPGTGKMFRSLLSVKRYLRDEKRDASPAKVLEESDNKCKQIIPFTTTRTSNFMLPDGWIIEKRQRQEGVSAGVTDKYYVEPGTGHRFRSLRAVERHLRETTGMSQIIPFTTESTSNFIQPDDWIIEKKQRCEGVSAGRIDKIELTPLTTQSTSNFVLPDGWIVLKKRRRFKSYGHTFYKTYIEPETGNRFRSLIAVERHLKEAKEYTMTLEAFKHSHKHNVSSRSHSQNECVPDEIRSTKVDDEHPTKSKENTTMPKEVIPGNDSRYLEHSDSPKKSTFGEEVEASVDDFGCPPSTINWVLAGTGGDMWNPFIDEFMVTESTKQKWSETFISSLHDEDLNFFKPGF